MRIIFLGTPKIAKVSLAALIQAGHEILAVVSQPDRPAGRGYKVVRGPVSLLADQLKISLFQPNHIHEIAGELAKLAPELLVVVAFGQILSSIILKIAPMGIINMHASFLPDLRGAAPIQRTIMCGFTRTGVTIMYLNQGIDTGDVILQEPIKIEPQDTSIKLSERLSLIGAELLVRTVSLVVERRAPCIPQNHVQATLAPLLSKNEGLVNWLLSARKLDCLIRGVDPWPGAFTLLAGRPLKLFGPTVVFNEMKGNVPGTIVVSPKGYKEYIFISCGKGVLGLAEVQVSGRRRMVGGDFIRGRRIMLGIKLGI